MVLLLSIVFALTAALVLDILSAQRVSAHRLLDSYQEHQAARGLQEIISQWLTTIRGQDLSESLGEDGEAFRLRLADGSSVRVRLHEAQGRVLTNLSGLGPDDADLVLEVVRSMSESMEPEELSTWVRSVGPLAISAQTAPAEAIKAVVAAVVPGREGRALAETIADELLAQRRSGPIPRGRVAELSNEGGASNDQRIRLTQLITADPVLWWITVDLFDRGPSGPASPPRVTYGGYVTFSASGQGAGVGRPAGRFLTWQRMGPEG